MFSLFNKKPKVGTSVTIKIDGMHCTSCSLNIDDTLEEISGVIEATTSYAKSKTVVVYHPDKISPPKMLEAIKKLGYQASIE